MGTFVGSSVARGGGSERVLYGGEDGGVGVGYDCRGVNGIGVRTFSRVGWRSKMKTHTTAVET